MFLNIFVILIFDFKEMVCFIMGWVRCGVKCFIKLNI